MQKLVIPLKLSRCFILLNIATLLLTIAIIFYVAIGGCYKFILLILTSYYWLQGITYQMQFVSIAHSTTGWQLQDRQGWKEVILLGDSTLTSLITVMRFQEIISKRKGACIIFRDTIDLALYKQLAARMRYLTE